MFQYKFYFQDGQCEHWILNIKYQKIMAHFNVTIPDSKVNFFKELLNSLSFAKIEQTEDFQFTESHKTIIDQRLENYQNNPDTYLDWEEVQKDIAKRL